jgi:hypothetical protein
LSPIRALAPLAFLLAIPAAPAFAQSATTQVRGSFGATSATHDESLLVTFSCTGTPTCAGQFNLVERTQNCSNSIVESNTFTMTGLNLAQSGPLQGTMTFAGANNQYTRLADGTCVVAPGATDAQVPYTGSWDLATKTGSITVTADEFFPGTFTADLAAPPPIFPMTVRASIDAVSATVSADIQFRAQDVGRQGSVFVFASAPATIVQGGLEAKAVKLGQARTDKAGETPCVLAQRTSSGQLVALTASQLQAFLSGTLSAQGAAVSVLNNVPTPSVAGATFYVGYGSSAALMLNEGVFRNAATVPGNSVCPMLPYQTALWWNPSEAGWGLNLNHQGNFLFGTLFTYDASRAPLWLVMSGGVMQSDGLTFIGDLFRTTGPAFNAVPFMPIGPGDLNRVGTMTVAFSEANVATLTYTVNGVEVRKSIQRQVYGTRSANCMPTTTVRTSSTNYQDLWWDPDESGWGINITHQDNTLFATLFTYDASGRDLWLVMSGGVRQSDGSYLGDLFRTVGSSFNAQPVVPLVPADLTPVGTMRLRFTDGENGTLTYTVNDASVTKSIVRQVFSSPVSACN